MSAGGKPSPCPDTAAAGALEPPGHHLKLEVIPMRWFLAGASLLFSLVTAAAGQEAKEVSKELTALQGTWAITREIADGKPVEYKGVGPGVKRTEEWVIAGRRIARRLRLTEAGKTRLLPVGSVFLIPRADPAQGPHPLDLKATGEGKVPLSVEGKVFPAIYVLAGDTLTICMSHGEVRPTEFKAEAGSGRTLWVLKRVLGRAAAGPRLRAAGAWSEPVADLRGFAVRGRLALYEKPGLSGRREVAVYVELQDASEAVGRSMHLFCDFGKTDFRPEYKGGLHCELHDKDQRPVPSTGFPFSGAVPKSQWVMLPSDATIRLRASPFGIHRARALAIAPDVSKLWVIADDDPNEYFLSGTFTVDPPADRLPPGDEHVWRGTIALPAVRIVNRPK